MKRRVDERRRAPRLRIALPVRFADGGEGVSRDISAGGIFVHTEWAGPHAEPLRLTVALGEWDTEGGFRIHGDGRVVRAETAAGKAGIALEVVWSDVEPLGPPAPEAPPADRR